MTSRFSLPDTGITAPPAFVNPVSCQDWLATVPMANPAQAQAMVLRQLNLLHRYTLAAADRLAVLESLRETVGDMQGDVAKKFAGKALPFTAAEQTALDGTVAVWHALLDNYLRCVEAAAGGETALRDQRALVAQRALAVLADLAADLCRGEQLPHGDFWRLLHQVFAVAEQMGVLQEPVVDNPRHGNTPTTVLGTYAETHLIHVASPFELPQRHLNWIVRWARRWGAKITLLTAPPADPAGRAIPLCVDLESDRPAGYRPVPGPGMRWMETTELRRSLKTRLVMLENGEQPSRLQLGEDCTQPAAGQLLQRVYQRWCKGGEARRQERKPAAGGCEFIVGLEAVHYYLSGRQPFRPPASDESMLRRQRDEIATFGRAATHHDEHYSTEHGYAVESWAIIDDWQLLDQSANGLRLSRPLKGGVRIGTGQIVAVKLAGSGHFTTGCVRWALHDTPAGGEPLLSVGIQLFPGSATPVALRGAEPGSREPYRQGLLLPAIPAIHEAESVIAPVGTFRIGRMIEVFRDKTPQRLTLAKVLDRGGEFERCSFSSA